MLGCSLRRVSLVLVILLLAHSGASPVGRPPARSEAEGPRYPSLAPAALAAPDLPFPESGRVGSLRSEYVVDGPWLVRLRYVLEYRVVRSPISFPFVLRCEHVCRHTFKGEHSQCGSAGCSVPDAPEPGLPEPVHVWREVIPEAKRDSLAMAMEAAKEADRAGSPVRMVAELGTYDFSRSGNLRSEARQLVGRFLDWWREPAVMQIPHGVGPCSYRERQFAEAKYTLSLVVRVHRESAGILSGEEGPGESDVLAPIVRQVAEITRIDATSFRETSGVDCRCAPSGRPATPDPVERPPLPPLPRRPPTGGAPRDANPPPPEPGSPPGDEGNYSPEFLPVSDEQANPALQDFIVEGTPQSGPVARRGRNVPSLTLTEALMPATPAAAQAFWPARRSAAGPPPAIGTSWRRVCRVKRPRASQARAERTGWRL